MTFLMTREEYDREKSRSEVRAEELKMDRLCGDISEEQYQIELGHCFAWMDMTEIVYRDSDPWNIGV